MTSRHENVPLQGVVSQRTLVPPSVHAPQVAHDVLPDVATPHHAPRTVRQADDRIVLLPWPRRALPSESSPPLDHRATGAFRPLLPFSRSIVSPSTSSSYGLARLRDLLFSPAGRPVRFAITGGLAALLQLTLLTLLTGQGWTPDLANIVAFLLAAQFNFAASSVFTWRDRLSAGPAVSLPRRWLAFHGSIAGMAVVNLLTYTAARHVLPVVDASIVGIAAAALGNFFLSDRLVFRPRRDCTTTTTSAPTTHRPHLVV